MTTEAYTVAADGLSATGEPFDADTYERAAQDPEYTGTLLLDDFKPAFQADVREASELRGSEAIEAWSHIIKAHVSTGNNKITKTTSIFNLGSAHDCPNRDTPACQVPWEYCYAGRAEGFRPHALPYRRRQEYLRDCLDAETFGQALCRVIARKHNPVDSLRISEAGDFRTNADIVWINRVAQIVREAYDIDVYTYTASYYLDWTLATEFTVNASNDLVKGANRRFKAVDGGSELPEGAVWCPNDWQKRNGKPADEAIKCGECRLCINPEGPDVAIPIHG